MGFKRTLAAASIVIAAVLAPITAIALSDPAQTEEGVSSAAPVAPEPAAPGLPEASPSPSLPSSSADDTGPAAVAPATGDATAAPAGNWALYETFDGDPASPSQDLLPDNWDFVATHRVHPTEVLNTFGPYPADHGEDCAGPNPAVSPLPSHSVTSNHHSNGDNPDNSFFICKNHMMSSLGDVSGYGVTAFYPQQEFEFSAGGTLEFDVNIDHKGNRFWWEVMILPSEQLTVAAAEERFPIDEVYPGERIVFNFMQSIRQITTGGQPGDAGVTTYTRERQAWGDRNAGDPAVTDRRVRRTNRIEISPDGRTISWGIEREDGSFDTITHQVNGGVPLDHGMVVFTTHAYTPKKDNNYDNYTLHWDNIGFTGPVGASYETYEAPNAIWLENNGNRRIGDRATQTIEIDRAVSNTRLFGQIHAPINGQVLLSVNGSTPSPIDPHQYENGGCGSMGWSSFVTDIDPNLLVVGTNTFEWTVGPRPPCANSAGLWDGFSVKSLEVQVWSSPGTSPPPTPDPDPDPEDPNPPPEPDPDPEDPNPPAPGPEEGAGISGQVTYVGGAPAAGVKIDLFRGSANVRTEFLGTTTSGDDGSYHFDVDPGRYILTFIAPDGDTFVGGRRWYQPGVDVGAAAEVTGIDGQLVGSTVGGASIGGVITEPDGRPIENAQVDLFVAAGDGSRGQFLRPVLTDASGRFRFDLQPGCYVLTYIAPEGRVFDDGRRWYQPRICVDAGESLEMNATLLGL